MENGVQRRKTALGPELGHSKRIRDILFRVNPEQIGQGRMSLSCMKTLTSQWYEVGENVNNTRYCELVVNPSSFQSLVAILFVR